MNGAPPDKQLWPSESRATVPAASDGLPSIPAGPPGLSGMGELFPKPEQLSQDFLRTICESWRGKRLEYPGWLVAPKESRDSMWAFTKDWIEPILGSLGKLSPPENMFLLFELNWRLEVSLTPLFLNWVEKMTQVVEQLNPLPLILNMPNATITPSNEPYNQCDWSRITECWVQLAFALAREARDDQDEKRFRLWMGRLAKLVSQRDEWKARWHFENCMFSLQRIDEKTVRHNLTEWLSIPELPFWEAKRAAILAELGDCEDAEKIAESSLATVRSRLEPYSPDYALMSQEGWIMFLLLAIREGRSLPRDMAFRAKFLARWERLRAYRCHPWEEIETLQAILAQPQPTPKPSEQVHTDFYPGRVTVSHHFESGWDSESSRPAFEFLRLYEEAAIPMKCGNLDMFGESAVNAAKWVESFAPIWSVSSAIRTGDEKALGIWFDRTRIALLQAGQVDVLYGLLSAAVSQSLEIQDSDKTANASFALRVLQPSVELLSHITFRLDSQRLKEVMNLALRMYKLPAIHRSIDCHDVVRRLFELLLYAMPDEHVLKTMPELLTLPIPSEAGFELFHPDGWVEPFAHIRWLDGRKLPREFDRSSWVRAIANLIRVTEDGSTEARKRASLRLARLHEIDGLDECQKASFAKALWVRTDSRSLLPSDTWFGTDAFLFLPEPEEGIAKKRIRAYLLETEVPRYVQHTTAPDGKISKSYLNAGPNRYIRAWIESNLQPLCEEPNRGRFIDWTQAEVIQALEKSLRWWGEESIELGETPNRGWFDVKERIRKQFDDLVKLLGEVVLPKLNGARAGAITDALRLLSELEARDFCVLSALPSTLFVKPSQLEVVARQFREGLNSLDEEEVRAAVFGLYNWFAYSSERQIPEPPPDLLTEVVNRIAYRRRPALLNALAQMSLFVRNFPKQLTDNHKRQLCVALDYLLTDTALPIDSQESRLLESSTLIPPGERALHRQCAAKLAFRLYLDCQTRKVAIPDVLMKWRDVAAKESTPELRRAWPCEGESDS